MARTSKTIAGLPAGGLKAPKVPTFVGIAQPRYIWAEYEFESDHVGRTALPKGRKTEAVLVAPGVGTPETRTVRMHELLHARYTPDINATANKLVKAGTVSTHAINLAEDHRINKLGADRDLWATVDASLSRTTAEQFLERSLFDEEQTRREGLGIKRYRPLSTLSLVHAAIALAPYPHRDGFNSLDVTQVVGACPADTPVEADVAKAQELVDKFVALSGEAFAKKRKGKRAPAQLFEELATLVETVLREAMPPPPPPQPKAGDGDDQTGDGDQGGADGPQEAAGGDQDGPGGDRPDGDDNASDADPGANDDAPGSDEAEEDEQKQDEPERSPLSDIALDANPVKTGASEVAKKAAREKSAEEMSERAAKAKAEEEATAAYDKALKEGTLRPVAPAHTGAHEVGPSSVTHVGILTQTAGGFSLDEGKGWAPMRIVRPPLERPRRHLAPRLGKASLDGANPRHVPRWFVDRAIMDSVGRRPGGALLIDVSGSMNWSSERTQQLIDVCPALTVAIYSSCLQRGTQYGVMTILAERGKLVSSSYDWRNTDHGYGNVCDGPALGWLVKQPGPRVWFCDGIVTGPRDKPTANLMIDAFRLALLGNVTRTVSLEKTIGVLSGRERPDPHTGNHLGEMLAYRGREDVGYVVHNKMRAQCNDDRDRDDKAKQDGTSYAQILLGRDRAA